MTYEEAIEIISSNICYNLLGCMNGICKHTDEKPCAIQMAIDALQEKQTKRKSKARCDLYDCKCCGKDYCNI